MMINILRAVIYFIISGIILGTVVNIMTMINYDLKDDPGYDLDYDPDYISFIEILRPIVVPLLMGLAIIASQQR